MNKKVIYFSAILIATFLAKLFNDNTLAETSISASAPLYGAVWLLPCVVGFGLFTCSLLLRSKE
ncbi:hypothetical protein [Gayadomonas joobiniege]|uniref:hypothetical protein n=1 Tax=Gayadomonas joobiniege TaxID=1234606 RepID=UPI00036D3678|nr:hypothetical protein [Gayadomonas joobiniege]